MSEPIDVRGELDNYRPKRYNPYENGWMDPIIKKVARSLSAGDARKMAATKIVKAEEDSAPKRLNRKLRDLANQGVALSEIDDLGAMGELPLVVTRRVLRVKLIDCTEDDLRRASDQERDAAKKDHKARDITCDVLDRFADALKDSKSNTFGDWLDMVAEGEDNAEEAA